MRRRVAWEPLWLWMESIKHNQASLRATHLNSSSYVPSPAIRRRMMMIVCKSEALFVFFPPGSDYRLAHRRWVKIY